MAYPIIKFLFYPLCKILIRSIKGIDNIPKKASFIIIANHESRWDHLLLSYPILKKFNKKIHFIAVPTKWWALGSLYLQWTGVIPLYNPKQAYYGAKEFIKSGEIVGIFPEGRLERKKRIENPKTGAIRLAIETKIPILPMGIKFNYKPFSSTINIGKPIYFRDKRNIKKQTKDLMGYVYKLRDFKG